MSSEKLILNLESAQKQMFSGTDTTDAMFMSNSCLPISLLNELGSEKAIKQCGSFGTPLFWKRANLFSVDAFVGKKGGQ
jgi:hypothetical protein